MGEKSKGEKHEKHEKLKRGFKIGLEIAISTVLILGAVYIKSTNEMGEQVYAEEGFTSKKEIREVSRKPDEKYRVDRNAQAEIADKDESTKKPKELAKVNDRENKEDVNVEGKIPYGKEYVEGVTEIGVGNDEGAQEESAEGEVIEPEPVDEPEKQEVESEDEDEEAPEKEVDKTENEGVPDIEEIETDNEGVPNKEEDGEEAIEEEGGNDEGEGNDEDESEEVKYVLADYFSKIKWVNLGGGVSLSLYPTQLLTGKKEGDKHQKDAFAKLEKKYSTDNRWANTESMRAQYDCYVLYAGDQKVPWNLEPHRTETAIKEPLLNSCKPEIKG